MAQSACRAQITKLMRERFGSVRKSMVLNKPAVREPLLGCVNRLSERCLLALCKSSS